MVKKMSVSVIDILSTKTKKDADIAAINYLLADKNVDKELICDELTGKYSLFFNDRAEDKTYTFLLSNKTPQNIIYCLQQKLETKIHCMQLSMVLIIHGALIILLS